MGTEYAGYKLIYDYHTHTVFSHGKGSIEENVKAAREAGLKGIGISDHGPGHLTYGMKRKDVPAMRKEIERLSALYPDIDIWLSVEANIINSGNYLDVRKDEFKDYDYVIAGYHYGIKDGYCVQNFVNGHAPGKLFGKSLLAKNTEMTLGALYENKIKILTHPGDKGPFDMDAIAKACAERGTLMEISTWHKHLTLDEIKIAAKYDVQFVVSSDAHTPGRVGDVSEGIKRACEARLDLSRIVNISKIERQL